MCLIDNRIFRFTLRKIPVYKVVEWSNVNGCCYSPFMHTKVGRISIPKNRKSPTIVFNGSLHYEFGEGFIHAYDNLTDARKAVVKFNGFDISILEGYIPSFTRYAIDCEDGSICARKMIFPDI